MDDDYLFDDITYSQMNEAARRSKSVLNYAGSKHMSAFKQGLVSMVLVMAGTTVVYVVNSWLDAIGKYSGMGADYEKAKFLSDAVTVSVFCILFFLSCSKIEKSFVKARIWRSNGASQRVMRLLINSAIIRGVFLTIVIPVVIHFVGTFIANNASSGYG